MVDAIIDGSSLWARHWYAVMAKPGNNTGTAVRASLVTFLTLLNINMDRLDEHVDRLLFAWDGKNKRDKNRAPKPPEYHNGRELFKETLTELFGAAHGYSDVHEADDVVATAVHNSTADTVFVVSGDKDLQQLHGGKVRYYCLNEKVLLSERSIRDKFGVKKPSQIAIALAILGEKIDLVNGIRGWGPKRVKQLFTAVTPEMNFQAALDAIVLQIPEDLRDGFWRDLDLTLLNPFIPDVPQPALIKMAAIDVAEGLELDGLMDFYRPVYARYNVRTSIRLEEVDDEY